MQYVLTQDEKDKLVPLVDLEACNVALEEARKEILKAHMRTCIHDAPSEDYDFADCGDCPCSPIGTHEDGKDYKTWDLICSLPKQYSQ